VFGDAFDGHGLREEGSAGTVKPHFQNSFATIYCADVRDLSGEVAGVDLALFDPPYSETAHKWDKWPQGWPGAVLAMIKEHGALWCFGSLRMFLRFRDEFEGWRLSQDIVWEKHNGAGLQSDRFRKVHEQAAMFYRDGVRWSEVYKNAQREPTTGRAPTRRRSYPSQNGGRVCDFVPRQTGTRLVRSVMFARSSHRTGKHETQKPESILRRLIDYSCPERGTVFDGFMGSAESLRIAVETGRCVVGADVRRSQADAAASMFEAMERETGKRAA
jgi:site-specific DNA-methyltransferase (adenine-specific)